MSDRANTSQAPDGALALAKAEPFGHGGNTSGITG